MKIRGIFLLFVMPISIAFGQVQMCPVPTSLDSLIISQMAQDHIPGLAACIVKGDSIVWHQTYGFARLGDSIPVVDTTVFDLASVSKTATGVAVMQLCERGVFVLDEDVNQYLPFPVHHPWYPDSAITIRMLLTHTSGIADYWPTFQRLQRQGDPDVSLRRFVEGYLVPGGEFYDSTTNFHPWPPGAQYRYCNLAIALAGYLVEANGDSFHLYTRDSIFRPLSMNRTVWYFRDIDTNSMAMPYSYSGGEYIPYGHQSLPDIPAGTMKSSTLQLARFVAAMMNYGCWQGVRILDSTTVALMTTVQNPAGVGLVFHQNYIGTREIWGHGGLWNGISTRIAFCRAESSGVVVLCNMDDIYATMEGVFLPALFDWAAAVAERASPPVCVRSLSTVVTSKLVLTSTLGSSPSTKGILLDITGRKVANLKSGINDINHLAPGVYFLFESSAIKSKKPNLYKIIVVK